MLQEQIVLDHNHVKNYIKYMKTHYIRTGGVYVEIDSDSKLIKNVLNTPTQKTISVLNNLDYYNTIMTYVDTWTITDENTFKTNYDEVFNYMNNL